MISANNPLIALMDERSQVFGPPIAAVAAALQIQVSRDFAPRWGRNAKVVTVRAGRGPIAGSWLLVILDYAGGGALGHHFVTREGLPQAVVGAVTSGERWPTIASHELLEMLANPWLDSCVYAPSLGQNIPCEVCDPCGRDAYHLNPSNPDSIRVSNFVYPSWFGSKKKGAPYDQMGRIHRSFEVSPNGGRIDPRGCPQANRLEIS
jgi:hypothetical protein